jgi:hypothetical protein
MRPRAMLSPPLFLCIFLLVTLAQAQEPNPRIVKLDLPAYLPIAVQAQTAGQVQMELTIGQDGSVTSWEAISGHPILVRAVTDSLPQARFACDGCRQQAYRYVLTYEFILPEDRFASACAELAKTGKEPAMPPSTLDSSTHVTVRPARAMCLAVDPATPRVRSARCLWLWKCALQRTPPVRQTPSAGPAKE